MRVGAIIKSYHATSFLPIVLKQIAWVDKIVVLNYRFKTAEVAEDNTREICSKFDHKNLIVDSGEGLSQWEIHNRGVEQVKDCELSWILDADEIILKKDQDIIIDRMKDRCPYFNRAEYAQCSFIDYKDDLYHASPERSGLVTVLINPNAVKFSGIRHVSCSVPIAKLPDAYVHHMMTVFPKETLDWKAEWEHKEEKISKDTLLENWKLVRNVLPPKELVGLIKEASLG